MSDDLKAGSGLYNIIKLNEENYRSWKQQVEFILDEFECLELVEGTKLQPVTPVAPATVVQTRTYDENLARWMKKKKKKDVVLLPSHAHHRL